MQNSSFILFILVVFSVISALGGIALLIIGLIQNKTKLWIPGSIIFTVAIIIGIISAVYSLRPFVSKFSQNMDKLAKEQKNHKYSGNSFYDSINNFTSPVDSSFSNSVTGFIYDFDNNLIYIKVFPNKELYSKGIILEKVSKGEKTKTRNKSVSLILNFQNGFNGKLNLTLFNFEKKEIGNSVCNINKQSGEIEIISFSFADDVKLSAIDYCTLNIE